MQAKFPAASIHKTLETGTKKIRFLSFTTKRSKGRRLRMDWSSGSRSRFACPRLTCGLHRRRSKRKSAPFKHPAIGEGVRITRIAEPQSDRFASLAVREYNSPPAPQPRAIPEPPRT